MARKHDLDRLRARLDAVRSPLPPMADVAAELARLTRDLEAGRDTAEVRDMRELAAYLAGGTDTDTAAAALVD